MSSRVTTRMRALLSLAIVAVGALALAAGQRWWN
jgi:hypothetical protein